MDQVIACAAALGIGLSLGLIGAGGSILTIPVFVYILKNDPLSSSVYAMFVVGVTAITGSLRAIVLRQIDYPAAVSFGLPSVLGVTFARRVIFPSLPEQLYLSDHLHVSKDILFMIALSALMLVAAVKMLTPVATPESVSLASRPFSSLLVLRGFIVGIVTGLLGMGGGFLVVPALYYWAAVPLKRAVNTALVIIAGNCFFAFLNSYQSTCLDWNLLVKFCLGAIAGILIGQNLSARIQTNSLKKIFAGIIFAVAVYIAGNQFIK
jgi:uncharacterized membrane protein YfcA